MHDLRVTVALLKTASAAPLVACPRVSLTFSMFTVGSPRTDRILFASFASSTTVFAVSALMFKDLVTSSPALLTGNSQWDPVHVSTMSSALVALWMALEIDKKGLATVPSPLPSLPSSEAYSVAARRQTQK